VLSKNYFNKLWTNLEFDALLTQERPDKKVIMPIWLNINEADVKNFSPIAASRKALSAEIGSNLIAREIRSVVVQKIMRISKIYDGSTYLTILPEQGLVTIGNHPKGGKISSMKVWGFGGDEIDLSQESSRIQAGTFSAFEANFDGPVLICRVNEAICTEDEIKGGVYFNLSENSASPYIVRGVAVLPGFFLGIGTLDIIEEATTLMKHARIPGGINSKWRKIVITEDRFAIS
jgi:hypothetical protein